MSSLIEIDNASLRFRIYRNPTPTLKEWVMEKTHLMKRLDAVKEFYALKNINLTFNGGDRVGIIGLNGAGKSTLLKMIVGIYPPHNGRVFVNGRITPMIELGTGFDVELSGRDNIYINGAILGYSHREMAQREIDIIEFSEIGEFIDMPVKYYSSGMYGRLAFSIATMVDPEILVIDEIFSAGDAHFVAKGSARMLELFNNSHIVLYVSHALDSVRKLCNKVVVLNKGEVVNQGNTEEMIQYYLTNIVT
jgi:ABC-type polysaccharide/polyol phosphate transport system ATPase subunit